MAEIGFLAASPGLAAGRSRFEAAVARIWERLWALIGPGVGMFVAVVLLIWLLGAVTRGLFRGLRL